MDIYSVWPPISYLFSLISLIVFELVNLEKKQLYEKSQT